MRAWASCAVARGVSSQQVTACPDGSYRTYIFEHILSASERYYHRYGTQYVTRAKASGPYAAKPRTRIFRSVRMLCPPPPFETPISKPKPKGGVVRVSLCIYSRGDPLVVPRPCSHVFGRGKNAGLCW